MDYGSRRKVFDAANGAVVEAPTDYSDLPAVAPSLDVAQWRAVIRDSQQRGQPYHAFTKRAMAAGGTG